MKGTWRIIEFASRSPERGKTERVGGTVDGHGAERLKATTTSGELKQRLTGSWPSQEECIRMPLASEATISTSPADSLWSSSHINFHHKRPNGTFVNGPRLEYEVTGVLVRAIITVALVAALAASCSWLLNRFLEAETAIIHSISAKGGK